MGILRLRLRMTGKRILRLRFAPLRMTEKEKGRILRCAQNDLVFIVILSDRRESKDLRLTDGDSSPSAQNDRETDSSTPLRSAQNDRKGADSSSLRSSE